MHSPGHAPPRHRAAPAKIALAAGGGLPQTGGVIFEMPLETWVSVATLLGFAVTVVTTVLVANGRTRKDLGTAIGGLDERIDRLDGKVGDLRVELKSDLTRLDGTVDDVRAELKADITRLDGKVDDLRVELKADITRLDGTVDDLRTELKSDITHLDGKVDDLRTELKSDMTRIDDRVFALAIGLKPLLEDARTSGPAA